MKFTLEINCENDSFQVNPINEITRILLLEVSKARRNDDGSGKNWNNPLLDANGNTVGRAQLITESA